MPKFQFILRYILKKPGIKSGSYSLLRFLLKKLAHSEQVFLLPTQKTGDMPTINVSKYFIRNKNISGLASAFAQKITKLNECKEENTLVDLFFFLHTENKIDDVKETFSLGLLGFVEACTEDKCQTCTVKSDLVNVYS